MHELQISLPDPLKKFVDDQVNQGRYETTNDYLIDLISAEEKRIAKGRLEALLLEGLEGDEAELPGTGWSDIRAEALTQVQVRAKKTDADRT